MALHSLEHLTDAVQAKGKSGVAEGKLCTHWVGWSVLHLNKHPKNYTLIIVKRDLEVPSLCIRNLALKSILLGKLI